ncbi:MAG TPA: type II 3-dehydroquinate dehydratase [Chloroflexota bacterium]|nr:type II 3-dehydroquinate dehydratase [Chloroflexota bacterium]
MKFLVVNGPNVNLLGYREPHIYGSTTLADVQAHLEGLAKELGDVEVEFFHSNHEGAIIDRLHAARATGLAGCILNPGGLTHYSVSLHDAIKAVDYPFVEVHITNIQAREEWRHRSLISPAAVGTIAGLGWRGYELALRYLVERAREQ